MATTTATSLPLDHETAERLSAAYNRCYEVFEAPDDLFTEDAFFDLMPPFWRFQLQGPDNFVSQLRKVAEGQDVSLKVLGTVPTATGFITEHEETATSREDGTTEVARRVHICEVRDGRIAEVTTYCNGGWDEDLRTRHAAEAPMIRP